MLLPVRIFLSLIFFHLVISTPLHNTSSPSQNHTLSTLIPIPYRFRVPTTKTVLRLGFGLIPHRIDASELQTLIHFAKGIIQEDYVRYGGNTLYPREPSGRQYFSQLGWGIELTISNGSDDWRFTYQELYEAVEGLRLYLVIGGRNWETGFKAWNGPGRWPDVGSSPFARGTIKRVGRTGERGEE